jgi:hypothetical protein
MVITCAKCDLPGEDGADGVARPTSVAGVVDLRAEVLSQKWREVEGPVAQQLPASKGAICVYSSSPMLGFHGRMRLRAPWTRLPPHPTPPPPSHFIARRSFTGSSEAHLRRENFFHAAFSAHRLGEFKPVSI